MGGDTFASDDGSTIMRCLDGGLLIVGPWHGWFAWHPVWTIHAGWVWLTRIERQNSKKQHLFGVVTYVTNYRATPPAALHSRQGESRDGT